MKKALITGNRGQDGAYLARLLLEKGYEVYGADRSGDAGLWRLRELGIEGRVKDVPFDLLNFDSVKNAIERTQPDEVYNFAAQSFTQLSFAQPIQAAEVNAVGVARVLEAIRQARPQARFFQASTAEIFTSTSLPKKETDPFHPKSPYAVAKLYAHWLTVNCREAYGLHASCGILFNHESPLRGEEFLTRKITLAAARIKKGLQEKVAVGNLDARRDWGYAGEYVQAMWLMLQQPKADDYILATGQARTVREFIETAFAAAGYELAWQGKGPAEKGVDVKTGRVLVEVNKEFYRPAEVEVLIGDASKAKAALGWAPKTDFKDMVAIMAEADIKRLEVKK